VNRGLRLALIILLFVALLLGGLYLARRQVAEVAIGLAMEMNGLPSPSLKVGQVEPERIVIEDLVMGGEGQVAAKRILVRFDWSGGVTPGIAEVEIADLALSVDARGEGSPLGDIAIDGFVQAEEEEESGESGLTLPLITLKNGRARVLTAAGPLALTLDGSIAQTPSGDAVAGGFDITVTGAEGQLIGRLDATLPDSGDQAVALRIDEGDLTLGEIALQGIGGQVTARQPEAGSATIDAALTLSRLVMPEAEVAALTIAVAGEAGRFDLTLASTDPNGRYDTRLTAEVTDILGQPDISGTLGMALGHDAGPLGLVDLPWRLTEGRVDLDLGFAGRLPALQRLADDPAAAWREAAMDGSFRIRTAGLGIEGVAAALDSNLAFAGGISRGIVYLQPAEEGSVDVTQPAPALLAALDLPPEIAARAAEGLTLRLPMAAEIDPLFYLQPAGEGHRLDLSGVLDVALLGGGALSLGSDLTAMLSPDGALGDFEARRLRLTARGLGQPMLKEETLELSMTLAGTPDKASGSWQAKVAAAALAEQGLRLDDLAAELAGAVTLSPKQVALTLATPSNARLQRLTLDGDTLIAEGARLTDLEGEATLDLGGSATALTAKLTAQLAALTANLPEGIGQLQSAGGKLAAEIAQDAEGELVATLDLSGFALSYPQESLSIGGLAASLPYPLSRLDKEPGRFTVADISLFRPEAFVSGISLSGSLSTARDRYVVKARGSGPLGAAPLAVNAWQERAGPRGGFSAEWGPAVFSPDGLQPTALGLPLPAMEQVEGSVTARVEAAWDARGLDLRGQGQLVDLSLFLPPARIDKANGSVVFRSLDPLATDGPQLITLDSLDLGGVALTNVVVRAAASDGARRQLSLRDASARIAGGLIKVQNARFDADAPQTEAVLELSGIDLGELVALFEVEDLSVTGAFSGRLPLVLRQSDQRVTLNDGRLYSIRPGVIKYGSPGTASIRAGGEQSLTLALEALENFHYDSFDVTVSKGEDGRARLRLAMKGRNPDLLDAQEINLNINLDLNLEELLTALQKGYALSPELFDGAWSFGN